MKRLEIEQVGIMNNGCLFVKPRLTSNDDSEKFEFVYRAGKGVYWDKGQNFFHAAAKSNQEATNLKWLETILNAVSEELGRSLEISENTSWTGISNFLGK